MSDKPNEPEKTPESGAAGEGDVTPPRGGVMDSIRAAHGLSARARVDLEGDAAPERTDESAATVRTPRYTVGKEIARGGMGAIFKVCDQELRRTLAMKVLLASADKREPGTPVDGCERRPLRHSVFDGLRETPGWQAVTDKLEKR